MPSVAAVYDRRILNHARYAARQQCDGHRPPLQKSILVLRRLIKFGRAVNQNRGLERD